MELRPHIVLSAGKLTILDHPHYLVIVISLFALSLLDADSAMAKSSAKIYHEICTPCHGAKGEGRKPMGPSLRDSEFVKKGSDEEVKNVIKNGRYGLDKLYPDYPSPMPSRKAMSDEDLDGLVKYLKTVIVK